jgi:hypothetical protein
VSSHYCHSCCRNSVWCLMYDLIPTNSQELMKSVGDAIMIVGHHCTCCCCGHWTCGWLSLLFTWSYSKF